MKRSSQTEKITLTMQAGFLEQARDAVERGEFRSISAWVNHAISRYQVLLAEPDPLDLFEQQGGLTAREREGLASELGMAA